MFRQRLFKELLAGTMRLQSVPPTDISAAQSDIKRLSLRQLLRIRVFHLEFTPSGCGADTVSSVGGTHEAFLATLDGLLFKGLGMQATSGALPAVGGGADAHAWGRQAILHVAASAALLEHPWWCWWVTEEKRIFFNAMEFESGSVFPSTSGVLEIVDHSKRDVNEPTGRLRWFDWRVYLITAEGQLANGPRRPGESPDSASDVSPSPKNSKDRERLGESPVVRSEVSTEDLSNACGSGTAGLFSPEVLHNMRGALKKTGGPRKQLLIKEKDSSPEWETSLRPALPAKSHGSS